MISSPDTAGLKAEPVLDNPQIPLGELLKDHIGLMHSWAQQFTGNVHEAEEIVQSSCLKAVRKIDQLREPDSFSSWLHQIVRTTAINHFTRRKSVQSQGGQIDLSQMVIDRAANEPSAVIERSRIQALVYDVLSRLRPDDTEVLRMFYLRSHSIEEIANALGSPIGTVKRRLHVARGRFQQEWMKAEPDETDV